MSLNTHLLPEPVAHYHDKQAVCLFLRISRATLNRWIRDGNFPPPRIIGNIIIGWPTEIIRYTSKKH